MAKAASNDGDAIGKLKDILNDTLPVGADFQDVIAAVMAEFTGQNAAYLETIAGQMQVLNNTMSDFNELIGKQLAENLKMLIGWFKALPEGIQTFIVAVTAIGTVLAPVLVSLSSLISILNVPAIGAAIVTFFEWLLVFLGPAGWILLGLIALGTAWAYWWDEINGAVKAAYEGIKWWLGDKLGQLMDYVATLPAKVVAAFKWMYNAVVGFSFVPDMVDGIASQFSRLQGVMVDPALGAIGDVTQGFADLAATPVDLPTLSGAAGAGLAGAGGTTVNITMSGMLGTDDPQTRSVFRQLVSDALMDGMRGSRLMGTA